MFKKLYLNTIAAPVVAASLSFNRKPRYESGLSVKRFRFVSAALAAFAFFFAAQNLSAATYTVTTVADSGTGSLREAVGLANGTTAADTINFNIPAASCPSGVCTITLASQITFASAASGALTLNGTGAKSLIIDGGAGTNRIFNSTNASVTLTGITLTGGNANNNESGGAIFAMGRNFTLDGVNVTANTASLNIGGGIHFSNNGIFTIRNSTISNNSARSQCGGIVNSLSTLTISNTTISGNSATNGSAGAICSDGNFTLRNSTITNNSASTRAGGLERNNAGTLNIGSSIIAGNSAPLNADIDFTAGTITSAGYNLIGDNSSVAAIFPAGNPNANNDIVGTSATPVNPLLNALTDNGGQTPTRLPMTGSPVIDKGNAFASTVDQRGVTRPYDNPGIANATGGDGSDIGAVEVAAVTAATVWIAGRVITPQEFGLTNALVTLTDSRGNARTVLTRKFGSFYFSDVAAGETYILSVSSKRYTYAPQIFTANENLTGLIFEPVQ